MQMVQCSLAESLSLPRTAAAAALRSLLLCMHSSARMCTYTCCTSGGAADSWHVLVNNVCGAVQHRTRTCTTALNTGGDRGRRRLVQHIHLMMCP